MIEQAQAMLRDVIPNLAAGLAILIVGLMVVKMIGGAVAGGMSRSGKMEPALQRFLVSIVTTTLKLMVILAAIGKMGVETASFVAVLAAAGFAIGFALQGSLSNFASGVMILLFKPFREGDVVKVAGELGKVVEIGLFATILHNPENRKIIIGNTTVMSGVITNLTANEHLRVDMTFGIGYGDDLGKAIGLLKSILDGDARVLKDPGHTVAVVGHGASSIDLVCRPFVMTDDYWDVWFDTHRKVKDTFDAEGISIPFPQRDVHLHQVS